MNYGDRSSIFASLIFLTVIAEKHPEHLVSTVNIGKQQFINNSR